MIHGINLIFPGSLSTFALILVPVLYYISRGRSGRIFLFVSRGLPFPHIGDGGGPETGGAVENGAHNPFQAREKEVTPHGNPQMYSVDVCEMR